MSFDEAAAVCDGAAQALDTLRQADVQEGRRIVIYGASGSLGTAAVQLAKHFGAHVTAVCGTDHVELVRSLGADEVVDYRQQDFTRTARPMTRSSTLSASTRSSGPTLAEARRGLRRHRWRAFPGRNDRPAGGDAVCRQQASPIGDRPTAQTGCPVPEGTHRSRRVPSGHRSALPDGGGGRGAPVRRDVAQGGQCRLDDRDRRLRAGLIGGRWRKPGRYPPTEPVEHA